MSDDNAGSMTWSVGEEDVGVRLDRFLAARVSGKSRSYLGRLIQKGGVLVDGLQSKRGLALKIGQSIVCVIPEPVAPDLEPEDIPLRIVFEDEDLAVIDKPAGLVVHPAAGNQSGTLVNALLFHLSSLSGIGDELRPGIVHRLDKDTSGLMMVAKNDRSHRRLSEMLAAREVHRHYAAIVWGNMENKEGEVDAPIGRDKVHRKMMTVREDGRPSLTRYSCMDSFDGFDYIRLELGSGRTHQIRVHMRHLGHPLLGDPVYGGRRSRLRGKVKAVSAMERELLACLDRQALHAFRLSFAHPLRGEEMSFDSPLAGDIANVLKLLEEQRSKQGEY